MTFVLQLRGSKKTWPRPVTRSWRLVMHALCALRMSLALLGLLGIALERPLAVGVASDGGVLPVLCGVLTAAVSATLGLLIDATRELSELFSHDFGPGPWLSRGAARWFGGPLSPFCIYPADSRFPQLSWYSAASFGLVGAAFSRLGGRNRREPEERRSRR